MIENGTILQNRYLIEKQIGAGGMGAVYLAIDQRFGSPVAIKETFYKEDEFGDAFEREAKLLNSLHHPVLPHVSDFFTEAGGHFLVMQFIEGEDLSDTLKREHSFSTADVLRWTNSLLDALDYLHSQQPPIIHRDIKPQNLKLTPRREIILLDFGLAKLNSEDASGIKSVFGYSRKYAPLEQIQGTGTDARSDIFALGSTAYHLLTGKPPLDALTRAAAIVAGDKDPLLPVNEVNHEISFEVAQVLHTAMKLNADQRFASAKAARQALEHALNAEIADETEQSAEQPIAAVASSLSNINSAEQKSFPALESFAAAEESSESLPQNFGAAATTLPNGLPTTKIPEIIITPENSTQLTDIATKISVRRRRSPIPLAALAIPLVCTVLAAGYFINKAPETNQINQTQEVQSTPELNSDKERQAPVSDFSTAKISGSSNTEVVKSKTKPLSIERPVEKNEKKDLPLESDSSVEIVEKPKPVQNQTPRPSVPQNARRSSQPRDSSESRSSEEEEAPVADIESVFTGQPTEHEKVERKEKQQKQRDKIGDDELNETRRQQKRRERQSRPNFPF